MFVLLGEVVVVGELGVGVIFYIGFIVFCVKDEWVLSGFILLMLCEYLFKV